MTEASASVGLLLATALARFLKLAVITGPVKLFCFPLRMGVSELFKVIQ